jgi:8-oxo-(d)GTP phosphatase
MANSKPESRLIKAAGAVAWRPGPDGRPEILLVHRRKYDDWSLPKGKVEPGEALPVTAVREVLEEGGARLALGRRLDSVRYNVGGRPKRVHYWSAAVASVDDHAVPNDEVDRVEWVAADRAAERISYHRDNTVIADFARLPAQTVPVILLRHAKAVAKSNWKRADDRRPLDDSGRADAKTLTELLGCFGPRARLITSPAVRCVETLRPFAELSGVPLRQEPSLYIHNQSSRTDPGDSPTSIAALLAEAVESGEPTIFCAHRENIPVLQAAALAALGLHPPASDAAPGSALAGSLLAVPAHDAFPELPKEWDDSLPTSGFWVLNLAHAPPRPAPSASTAPAPQSPPVAPSTSAIPSVPSSPASAGRHASAAASPRPPAWRRWFRFGTSTRVRTTTRTGTSRTASTRPEPLAAPVLTAETTTATHLTAVTPGSSDPPAPAAPRPRLISADRYDLTET